jgi:hypothetical protein
MCKALPDHPLGYSLFARCAMNGQQMKVAQVRHTRRSLVRRFSSEYSELVDMISVGVCTDHPECCQKWLYTGSKTHVGSEMHMPPMLVGQWSLMLSV